LILQTKQNFEAPNMSKNPNFEAGNSEFEVRVRRAIRSAKNSLPQVAVLVFSLENARAREGRLHSDSALMALSNAALMRLRSGLRESDSVALMSTGHLAVLLQTVQGAQDLDLIINRLTARLHDPIQINDVSFALEPRIGSALYPENGDSAEALIEYAELDLAASGATQPRARSVYSSRSRGLTARQWMSELRQAIISDQLFLAFQPKVNLSKGPVTGVEVLLRWHHPAYGVIVPDQFIPVAERTGLIIPLTLWVLQQSLLHCRQ
jgi:predicted signal transduction protein with EAL and GGDEF domain